MIFLPIPDNLAGFWFWNWMFNIIKEIVRDVWLVWILEGWDCYEILDTLENQAIRLKYVQFSCFGYKLQLNTTKTPQFKNQSRHQFNSINSLDFYYFHFIILIYCFHISFTLNLERENKWTKIFSNNKCQRFVTDLSWRLIILLISLLFSAFFISYCARHLYP